MLGEDLDPELLQALEASKNEYEAEQKKKENSDKLIADILLIGEMLQIPSTVLDNLTKHFNQYCQECHINAGSLKKVDFQRLIEALYDLDPLDLEKVKAHLVHDLKTSVSYVNQFNAILDLELSSKESFKDMIARPLAKSTPLATSGEEKVEQQQDEEEDEEFKKAIALSLASQSPLEPETIPVAASVSVSSSSSRPPSTPDLQKETIILTRQLRFILQIPGAEVESCLLALQAQKHWPNSLSALEAYEKSTKEYSSKGLVAFMQEGPKDKVAAFSTLEEKEPSTTPEKKRKRKKTF